MERYSRQSTLKVFGEGGQEALREKSVAVIGLGAVGSVVAELLARAGVGMLVLFDHDKVEASNLHRQLLYDEGDIGRHKVEAAARKLALINSEAEVVARREFLSRENVEGLSVDLILDGTDNFYTRFLINDYALKTSTPWIYAGAVESKGAVYPWTPGKPCLRCVFEDKASLDSCEERGVLNSATCATASFQAAQALRILIGGEPVKELVYVNPWNAWLEKVEVRARKGCEACNQRYEFLEGKQLFRLEFCKTKTALSAKPVKRLKLDTDSLKKKFEVLGDAGMVLALRVEGEEVVVHDYGEIFFKEEKNPDKAFLIAKKIYEVAQ